MRNSRPTSASVNHASRFVADCLRLCVIASVVQPFNTPLAAADETLQLGFPASVESPQAASAESVRLPVSDLPIPPELQGGNTLPELELLALSLNPSIAEREAALQSLHGKQLQMGLYPNPRLGYVGEEIGDEGNAGLQGAFVQQRFVRGGKLQRSQAIVGAELSAARSQLEIARRRVTTDVRQHFYSTLIAQRQVETTAELERLTREAVDASERLLEAEEISRVALLQVQVENQNATIVRRQAEIDLQAAWQQLTAVVGDINMQRRPLSGDLESDIPQLDLATLQIEIAATSPQLAEADAQIARAERVWMRECVEPIADVTAQASVLYNNSSGDTVAGVQVSLPVPIWNRNQGNISAAQAKIVQARRNREKIALQIERRLAREFQSYQVANVQVTELGKKILPATRENLELVRKGYREGEIDYLQLLTAQRTYAQTYLGYLNALRQMWQSHAMLEGRLLNDSLSTL